MSTEKFRFNVEQSTRGNWIVVDDRSGGRAYWPDGSQTKASKTYDAAKKEAKRLNDMHVPYKNPRPFGKRKAKHKNFPRAKPAPKFGKRPAPLRYLIQGAKGATLYYYAGDRFTTERANAIAFANLDGARGTAKGIAALKPDGLRYLKPVVA